MKRLFSFLLALLLTLISVAVPAAPSVSQQVGERIGSVVYDVTHKDEFSPFEQKTGPPTLALSATQHFRPRWVFAQNNPSFVAPLQTTLVPDFSLGSGTPTFTRATAATQTDFEAKLNVVLSGEARMQGARRVANKAVNSGTLTVAAGWNRTGTPTITSGKTDPDGGTTAYRISATGAGDEWFYNATAAIGTQGISSLWIKRVTGTGNIKFLTVNGATGTALTLTTSWQRFANAVSTSTGVNFDIGINISTSGDEVDIWHPQLEGVTGQANQNPSEYVSVGVLSAPYHGAGVDGVQYFNYLNGNTVASNVVTQAQGLPIVAGQSGVSASAPVDAKGPYGYLAEGARTNYFLQSLTPATQTIATLATGTYTASVGAGGTLAISAGTATITGGGTATSTTPLTFDVQVSGTVVATVASAPAWGQVELGGFASSLIPTTTVAVTRNADLLTYASAGNISGTVGTAYAEVTTAYPSPAVGAGRIIASYPAADFILGADSTFFAIYDGTGWNGLGTYLYSATTPIKSAGTWGGSTTQTAQSGIANATAAFDGDAGVGTLFAVGGQSGGGSELFGTIRNIRIYPAALSTPYLQNLTADATDFLGDPMWRYAANDDYYRKVANQ